MQVVRIIEKTCIGCTKCVPVCPVDAIVGATQQLHAVIPDVCIGCNLCLNACPVQCIEIIPRKDAIDNKALAKIARTRIQARKNRLAKQALYEQRQQEKLSAQIEDELSASLNRAKTKQKPTLWSECE
ncbi:MAG: RnfABCDGE type electron transport complex subunit B [Proteobacteria bacterium]|nr:RnfABCDGE type electron transport complex subunit B [Pseudomonadota bacterium]